MQIVLSYFTKASAGLGRGGGLRSVAFFRFWLARDTSVMRSYRNWTKADDRIVTMLRPVEAAKALSRPISHIYSRRNMLGHAPDRRPWTEAEEKLVIALPPLKAVTRLKRSISAVVAKRKRLRLEE